MTSAACAMPPAIPLDGRKLTEMKLLLHLKTLCAPDWTSWTEPPWMELLYSYDLV